MIYSCPVARGAKPCSSPKPQSRTRLSLRILALQSPLGPNGRETPDPFDRHSSARDKVQPAWRRANVSKPRGNLFGAPNRRRGRPAHLRSPDDSPLRDGNRDRLIGLLTERAVKTLLVYLQETNPSVYHWLFCYLKESPIPRDGSWDEISGEQFLRKMLQSPSTIAKFDMGRAELFDNVASTGVDPRAIAQRIMEIRVQLSKEFVQDLGLLAEENSVLLRETLQVSLSSALEVEPIKELPPRDTSKVFVHPELLVQGALHPEVAASHPQLLDVVRDQAATQRLSVPRDSPSPPPQRPGSAHSNTAPQGPTSPSPDGSKPGNAATNASADGTGRGKEAPNAGPAPAEQESRRPAPDSHPNSRPSLPKKPWTPKDIPGIVNPETNL